MRKILKKPFYYSLYQQLIGCNKYLKKLAVDFIKPFEGCNILEIGCATGNIIKYLKQTANIKYTGIDISEDYIKYSKNKYTDCNFICEYVNKDISLNKKFDIIFMEAFMSGCSHKNIDDIFNFIKNHIKTDTRIIISDTNYKKNNLIKKFLYEHERNSNMRTKNELIEIIEKYFKINKITEIKNPYYIPYEKIIFECKNIK